MVNHKYTRSRSVKFLFIFLATFFMSTASINAQNFITKWQFSNASTTLKFNALTAGGAVNYTWNATPSGNSGSGSFTKTSAGAVTLTGLSIAAGDVVTLTMAPTSLQRFYINNGADKLKLINVVQWGSVAWKSMQDAFNGCANLQYSATDQPNLSSVTNLSNMFRGCTQFNGNIINWNTSTVTNMSGLFYQCTNFNQNIGNWNTSQVTNMNGIFWQGTNFNQNIANWNTSQVINMNYMFNQCTNFNQNIGNWNTSAVKSMQGMFRQTGAFNQNIANWNTALVTNMISMFQQSAAFNQNIGAWTLHATVNMTDMLSNCSMDCSNYSATLAGWYTNNPTVTSRTLGANVRKYNSTVQAAERANLVLAIGSGGRGWTITGDALVNPTPSLVTPANNYSVVYSCNHFANISNSDQVVLSIDDNGNAFPYTSAIVTATNAFVSSLPAGVTTSNSGGGYYQITDGVSSFRISRRMFSIQVPGTYTVNGGVKVRVYMNNNDTTNIRNNAFPAGTISDYGWFKSAHHNAQDVVNEMQAGYPSLSSAIEIPSVVYGTESGVRYAEFKVQNFSTFGFYAKTTATPLPIELLSFDGKCQENTVNLTWKTASEENNRLFTIERSMNTEQWEMIGTQNGAGNSNEILSYDLIDSNPLESAYYRLKQTDIDGKFEYTTPIFVVCDLEKTIQPIVFPNPSNGLVNIQNTQIGQKITLFNQIGQLVYSQIVNSEITDLMLNDLPKGTYFIHLSDESNTYREKIVLQ